MQTLDKAQQAKEAQKVTYVFCQTSQSELKDFELTVYTPCTVFCLRKDVLAELLEMYSATLAVAPVGQVVIAIMLVT